MSKTLKWGFMNMTWDENRLFLRDGGLVRGGDATPMEWLTVDNAYMERFSPETLEALRDFRRRFKE